MIISVCASGVSVCVLVHVWPCEVAGCVQWLGHKTRVFNVGNYRRELETGYTGAGGAIDD